MADPAKQIAEARNLILEVQARLSRIVEMARIVQGESEHLTPDSEPRRFRACAEVIHEAAEMAVEEVDRVDLAFKIIGTGISGQALEAAGKAREANHA